MMTVHKIAGIDGPGYADYLTGTGGRDRRGDYYLGRSGRARENLGTWHGKGAEQIGVSGYVHRDDLLRIWEGRDPHTGQILVARGSTGEHVAGVDATFSAPKSVSVLWALADPTTRSAVEAAHEQAVLVALQHIEATVPLARRRISDDQVVHEQVAGIIAARFRHHTSRITADQHARGEVPDPQLHDHVVIANMALRGGDEPKWVAIDSRELFRVAAEAGAIYRAGLAAGLQRMGYGVYRDGRYFEVEGISARLREAFSARSEEVTAAIRRFMDEHGRPPTIAERKALVVLSREPKSVDHAPAFDQWTRRAEQLGEIDLPRPVYGPYAVPDRVAALHAVIADLSSPASPRFLNRDHAVVDDRTFRIAVAEAAQGRLPGTDFDWLFDRVQLVREFQKIDDGHWTTRAILDAENEVLTSAQRRADLPLTPEPETVAAAIEAARVPLSAEQRVTVERLARSNFGLLTAPAGAGKGEVLRTVAQVRKADGKRVIAVAAAGETAQRFGREIGADLALTVEGFTRWVENRRLILTQRDAVFIDEAGLLEDFRWLRLVRTLGPASVTATGDAAQMSPIEAGGLWRKLAKELHAVTLTENYRARDAWAKQAWTDLREGRALRGIARLERRRQIVISPTRASSREAAVEKWDADRREGAARGRGIEEYLLLATTSNVDVDFLNAAAQQRRLDAGELGSGAVRVTVQDDLGRERVEYFHVGDRVAFVRQVRFLGWRPRVENGATGNVISVDPAAQTIGVELTDRVVTLRGPQLTAVRLGYAQHLYRSQGRTVDRTYVVTGGWQTGRESTYTGASRSREATYVFTDYSSLGMETHNRKAALRELADRASESQAKISAIGWKDKQREAAQEAAAMQQKQRQPGARQGEEAITEQDPVRRAQQRAALARLQAQAPIPEDDRLAAERRAADETQRRRDEWFRERQHQRREQQQERDGGRE
jgi:conjugative relaxase-like TrwC/TraI family protein